MNKDFILSEIVRVAEANAGVAPGRLAFQKATGIKESDWSGKHWTKWSDAVQEAGYTPQQMQGALETEQKVERLIEVVRHYSKRPTTAEIKLYARNTPGFPSHNTLSSLGSLEQRKALVFEYCQQDSDANADVISLIPPVDMSEVAAAESPAAGPDRIAGYVYLMKSGKYHKIGRSVCAEKRQYELAIQLPEKLQLVHKIPTDDPAGIEAYWHNRFKAKRKNGEWFELSRADINAFRRRSYM